MKVAFTTDIFIFLSILSDLEDKESAYQDKLELVRCRVDLDRIFRSLGFFLQF